jgi:hypothetical protein
MSVEILNSAIMQLRGKAQEVYGVIKDIYRRPTAEGDADRIMSLSLKLAQIEGGLITLEQYAPEIVGSVAAERAAERAAADLVLTSPQEAEPPAEPEKPEPPAEAPTPEKGIGHDELMERSPTYRKSIEKQEVKAPTKKKKKS